MNFILLWSVIIFANTFAFNKAIKRNIFFNKYETTTYKNVINLGKIYQHETSVCQFVDFSRDYELYLNVVNNYCYLMAIGNLTKNVRTFAKVENNITVELNIQVINIKRTVEANSITLHFPDVNETKFVSLFELFRKVVSEKFNLASELQILVFGIYGNSSVDVTLSICKNFDDANSLLNTTFMTEKFRGNENKIATDLNIAKPISIVNSVCDDPPPNCSGSCTAEIRFEPMCEIKNNGFQKVCPPSKVLQNDDINVILLGVHKKPICKLETTLTLGCGPNTCLNRGTCNEENFGKGYRCLCPDGFTGPRCQQLIHGYVNESYSIHDPLPSFSSNMKKALLHISLEFTILNIGTSGLILYSGPIGKSNLQDDYYLIIKLTTGKLHVLIKFEGELNPLHFNFDSEMSLADLKWHRLDLIFEEQKATVIIDDTLKSQSILKKLRLNRYPLQLGGRIKIKENDLPDKETAPYNAVNGLCIQNVRINGELRDLHVNDLYGFHKNSRNECRSRNIACGMSNFNQQKCGTNGICHSLVNQEETGNINCYCVCKHDFRPKYVNSTKNNCNLACDIATSQISLKGINSYVSWNSKNYENGISHTVEFSFRTFSSDGTLFVMTNDVNISNFRFFFQNGFLKFDMGKEISLPYLNDGVWHRILLRIFNNNKKVEMMVDNGSNGAYFFMTEEIKISLQNLFAIGSQFGYHFLTNSSCFKDIRINNFNIPLNENDDSYAATIVVNQNTERNCLDEKKCAEKPCPITKPFCKDIWRSFSCSCPMDQVLSDNDVCVPFDGCTVDGRASQCKNKAACKWNTNKNSPECHCAKEWEGQFCDVQVIHPTNGPILKDADFKWYYILIIALIVLIILAAILVFIIMSRRSSLEEKESLFTDFPGLEKINETLVDYCEDGAGEEDYIGPLSLLPPLKTNDFLPESYILPAETNDENDGLPTTDLQLKSAMPAVHINVFDKEFIKDELPDETLAYEFEADKLNTNDYITDDLSEIDNSILNNEDKDDDDNSLNLENLNEWGTNFQQLAKFFNEPHQY